MVSPSIDRTGALALDSAAAVAGSNRGTIDRVFVTGGSIWAYAKIGGVAGHNRGTVSNSYSRMTVTGNTQVGGLVGWNETASGIITNSYAAGGVATHGEAGTRGGVSGTNAAADFGGLVGQNSSGAAVTASYWDTEASGQAASAGGTAKTTAQLQTPTGATGIYSAWGTVKWDFGTASEYPALKYDTDGVGGATWQEFGGQVRIAPVDYDTDNDGLIEVDSLVKLNALRYDLNGDGGVTPADKASYDTAFPNAQGSMGCLNAACAGYELMDDLNFDQNNDNAITSTDAAWWNSGAGWAPIGDWANPFNATFDGGGHTISNLYIRIGGGDVGLFGSTDTSSVIRNLGMVNPSIDRTGALTLDSAAAVAGSNRGAIQRVFVSGGSIWAFSKTGGLVGHNRGAISDSYSRMAVTGNTQVGGLVGWNENASGTITNSYAMGKVATQGLTGTPPGGGSRQNPIADVGGLVGKNDGGAAVTAGYWDTEASRQATSAGGAGAVGQTTAGLQSPTSATGIYATWAAATWDFGTASEYPALKYDTDGVGGATWQEFGSQARAAPPPPADYDTDDDGLIEVDSLAQLNAIRYDLDGNGAVTAANQASFDHAFPNAAASMGCAGNACTGYELTDDLNFDTDDDGDVDSSDDYPSWTAIGAWVTPFAATFDGGGHTISNMRIRAAIGDQGLFGSINSPGVLRNVAVLDVDIDRRGSPIVNSVGGLVGSSRGAVERSYTTGAVTGLENVGGLVGDNRGVVTNSYSSVTVNGNRAVGGLVGFNRSSTARITNSYAVGAVSAVGMLVSGGNSAARTKGGLVGEATANATVTASYWDATVSGQSASAGGAGAVSQTTAGLQSPTGATGIYATWAAATWDFGTASQYPALKYDTDEDSTATAYEFGVQGRSAPSAAVNGPPTFNAGYDDTPNIAEGATAVGTYAATDPESDPLTYAVTGTDAAAFAISGAGVLTLNDAANHETKPRYSVSVTVHDGKDAAGANDATVDITLALTVTVDDTLEPPTAPTNLQVFPVVEGLRVTWTAPVMPAAKPPLSDYDVQHSLRTSAAGDPDVWGAWLAFDHVGTGTTATITGLTAGSTYQVQALAKNNEGSSPWTAAVTGVPLAPAKTDYDVDGDNLIEVSTLAQLNALRYDLDGNGDSTHADYTGAFPNAAADMGCAATCLGYELDADLDFDTHGNDDAVTIADTYWNGGAGWTPIGDHPNNNDTDGYTAVFEGNGHAIANLFINQPAVDRMGLFGTVGETGVLRNLAVVDADVTGKRMVGTLAGYVWGTVKLSYATGSVHAAISAAGGLVGVTKPTSLVSQSYAAVDASATLDEVKAQMQTVGTDIGGLVGQLQGRVEVSYATGSVSGQQRVGGLVGQFVTGAVEASYSTGRVQGNDRQGGLVGNAIPGGSAGTVTNSYWDTRTSGQTSSAGGTGKTTIELMTPTAYGSGSDIYANWNLDLDGDTNSDDDPWDFGTASEYPALKADWDGNSATAATAAEFGSQARTAPIFADGTSTTVAVVESAPANQDIPGSPAARGPAAGDTLTYALSGTDAGHFDIDTSSGQLKTRGALERAVKTSYSVVVTATYGSGASDSITVTINVAVDYDTDSDGLIEVSSLDQLDALRRDLDGDGGSTYASYARAFPDLAVGMGCPDTDSDADTSNCLGYELKGDLDFDTHGNDDAVTSADTYWNDGAGWHPLGGAVVRGAANPKYEAIFEGNGFTISNLLINLPNRQGVGLFGALDTDGVIRNLGLVNATVTAKAVVGPLAGLVAGTVESSYATGSVTGSGNNVGGLAGRVLTDGRVLRSYTTAGVSGSGTNVGGLVGSVLEGTIKASYAAGNISGGTTVGGLVGEVNRGTVTASYARGEVQGANLVGGLVGRQRGGVTVTDSYWDTETSGQGASVRGAAKTTLQLQSPTQTDGYAGIYANWNIDVDGQAGGDDPWDFGTASEYPALKVEWDGDGTPSAYEFGRQGRSAANQPPAFDASTLTLSVPENTAAGVNIGNPVLATDADSDPLIYGVIGDEIAYFTFDADTNQIKTRFVLDHESKTSYSFSITADDGSGGSPALVDVTINVTNVVEGATDSVDYDSDDDGLIGVDSLSKLDAIRHDLDGDGVSTAAGYLAAFTTPAVGMGCPDTDHDGDLNTPAEPTCIGYELADNLTFDENGDGQMTSAGDPTYWNGGAGWTPLGDTNSTMFTAVFEGNGKTISRLFINRASEAQGLFGAISAEGEVWNLGLPNVNVTGRNFVGGLAGLMDGEVTSSYVTGSVTGSDNVGGLAGRAGGGSSVTTSYSTAGVTGAAISAGGLIGYSYATVTASYATGSVVGSNNVGGLVGVNAAGSSGDGSIIASYATGAVTSSASPAGPHLGGLAGDSNSTTTNSYWDVTTTGIADDSDAATGVGKTTSDLKTPIAYGSGQAIYANWNVDVDGQGGADDPWDFGTPNQYPALKVEWDGDGTPSAYEFGRQGRSAAVVVDMDYDTDDDSFIEVRTLAQLNALRWDLDGDGAPAGANANDYATAFGGAVAGMGCPDTDSDAATPNCGGYELEAALDFDENGDSQMTEVGDPTYWNGGLGWDPIGGNGASFMGVFEGNGHTISNLFIARPTEDFVGLFGNIKGTIRRVGLEDVQAHGRDKVGALVGLNEGRVYWSYVIGIQAPGKVQGRDRVGGLVGENGWRGGSSFRHGVIGGSYSTVSVTGNEEVGGLTGYNNESSTVIASYAAWGSVTGVEKVGGLVGAAYKGRISASYAAAQIRPGKRHHPLRGYRESSAASTPIQVSYGDQTVFGRLVTNFGKTTSELKTPAQADGYAGIYALWNVDVDGGNVDDPWDFGTSTEYPALKVDFNGDGAATVDEFGRQGRLPTLQISNDKPTFDDGQSTTRTIAENTLAGAVVGAPVSATDPDLDGLTYRLAGTDGANFTIDETTGQIRVRTVLDYETTTSYTVIVEVADGADDKGIQDSYLDSGVDDTITVTITVVNDAAETGAGSVDYDTDGNGLIEVDNLAKLNAMRWDMNGDGGFTHADYLTAFPTPAEGMGCPAVDHDLDGGAGGAAARVAAGGTDGSYTAPQFTCKGYELTDDLTFDQNSDGAITSADAAYWDGGKGWEPIGNDAKEDDAQRYNAVFEGGGHSISRLFINRPGSAPSSQPVVPPFGPPVEQAPSQPAGDYVGLFGAIGPHGSIRNVALLDVDVTGRRYVGALAGMAYGIIERVYATGSVSGSKAGGLAGELGGYVSTSYSTVDVSGAGNYAGGLVGLAQHAAVIKASYARGAVAGGSHDFVGALVGSNDGSITASYAVGRVSGSGADLGGLVGANRSGTITDSYWDVTTTGIADDSDAATGVGKTTANLKTPTAYGSGSDIYANWNLNLDGDVNTDDDPWDFGTASEYPVLKVDFNNDNTPTSAEFGGQGRSANAAPAFTEGAGPVDRSVPENTAANTDIGVPVGATDANTRDTLTYTLGGADAAHFGIVASSGQLQAKGALDFEGGTTRYQVVVSVADGRDADGNVEVSPAVDASITVNISVTNVNEAPAFGVVGPFAPEENQTAVVTLPVNAAVDPDAGATLTYGMVTSGASAYDHALFEFNAARVLTFKDVPDYENPPSSKTTYRVTIQVRDSLDAAGTADSLWDTTVTVTINLQDVNEAPTCSALSGRTRLMRTRLRTPNEEQTAAGTVGTIPVATDPDAGATLTYQMMEGAGDGDHALFTFVPGTRALTFKAAPNFEATPTKTTYTVKIRVRDSLNAGGTADTGWDDTVTVTINLQNVNEAPTFGVVGPYTPDENQTAVGTIPVATDPDAGATLTYEMMMGAGDGDHALFTFVPGTRVLTFKAAPNYEATPTKTTYTVKIRVRDSLNAGGTADILWDDTVVVTINLQNVNEAPEFPTGTTTRRVAENAGANANVGLPVTATDVDAGDTREYALSGADAGSFTINVGTGQITADATMDHEAVKNTFAVTVTATDDGGLTDTIAVTIEVTDVNEAPEFMSAATTDADGNPVPPAPIATATRSFREDAAAGTAIGAPVAATDPDTEVDPLDTLTYALAASGDHASFAIDTATGQLKTKAGVTYDYEAKDTYTVTVTVQDGKNALGAADAAVDDTIVVTINVTDALERWTPPTNMHIDVRTLDQRIRVSWTAPAAADNTGKPALTGYKVQWRQKRTVSSAWAPDWVDFPRTWPRRDHRYHHAHCYC